MSDDAEAAAIVAAVDAAIGDGLVPGRLRTGIIAMCQRGFADLRAQGEDTTGFVVDITRRSPSELDVRVRPPGVGPLGPKLVSGTRTVDQLEGTYRADDRCPAGECVCQFAGMAFPILVRCAASECPVPAQEVSTFADAPAWARLHRLSGCRSLAVVAVPKAEVVREAARWN